MKQEDKEEIVVNLAVVACRDCEIGCIEVEGGIIDEIFVVVSVIIRA